MISKGVDLGRLVQSQLPQLDESSLQCSICMDLIISCKTAVCGHSFCEECLSESLLRRRECPICRKDIRRQPIHSSLIVDQAVKLLIKVRANPEESERLTQRLEKLEKWAAQHQLKECLKPGQRIDVLDTEHIWCSAVIELKVQADGCREPLLLVHYEGWTRKYDEWVMQDSKRLALSGFYT